MIAPLALLAAVGDWLSIVVVIVVIIVGLLNQLFDAAKKKPPLRRPGGGGGGGQKSLLDEVERFLQEAKQQGRNPQPPQQQPLPKHLQQHVGGALPSQQKPQRQQGQKKNNRQGQQRREKQQQPQRLAQSERSRLQPQVDDLEEVRGGDLSRLSGQHLQTSRFEERAQHLSHLQQTVDTDIGGHVRNVFDHQVGSLSAGQSTGGAANTADGASPAQQLVALLGNADGLRNAVLMREILEPPTHRW